MPPIFLPVFTLSPSPPLPSPPLPSPPASPIPFLTRFFPACSLSHALVACLHHQILSYGLLLAPSSPHNKCFCAARLTALLPAIAAVIQPELVHCNALRMLVKHHATLDLVPVNFHCTRKICSQPTQATWSSDPGYLVACLDSAIGITGSTSSSLLKVLGAAVC